MNNSEEIIPRPIYLNHILEILDKGMMLVLMGQRRVGKSFILLQLEKELNARNSDINVIYINKELTRFNPIANSDQLYEYVDDKLRPDTQNYLLIDEIQDIVDFQLALRSLHAERKCQIVVTGSNAHIFSSELSTLIGGRYIEIPVYSLSYNEFLLFHNLENSDASLEKYLSVGGLPGLTLFDINNERQVNDYLQGVFSTIIIKDIISRESIRNVTFLENLITFMAKNIGKLFSTKKVTNTMNSYGNKISDMLTANYVRFIRNALLMRNVSRFDIQGKKIFEQIHKYYFTDHGLRNLLTSFSIRGSIEKLMENVIYNHLLIHGYKVYVGNLKTVEIDFIAVKGDTKIYIQSSYILSSQETIDREFGNLALIKDNYPKMVISMDPVAGGFPEYPGIIHQRLRDFLTSFV